MSSPSVCKVGMYWERPTAPRMFSPSSLILKGQHKEARQHNASTASLIQYDKDFTKQTSWVRAETVEARTSKRAKALSFKQSRSRKQTAFSNMADNKRVKRKIWPTRIYDYNYKVSEGYYKPQRDYMDTASFNRRRYSPPKHQSYAERFASNPWYGNTKGLPYNSENSALIGPLLKPSEHPHRSSSLVKEIRDIEDRDIPLHIRASRRRRRFEEQDEELGIRPRFDRQRSLEDKLRIAPRYKDVADKLRSLDVELQRLAPRRTSVTEDNYSSPSGTHHSSYKKEVSHYNSLSSRPPPSPRVRKISFNEEFSDLPPRPRARVNSFSEQSSRVRRTSVTENEDLGPAPYFSKASKLREERKFKESRDMTDNVHKMIEKMRIGRVNPEDGYNVPKDTPSTLDYHLKDERKIPSSFVYGLHKNI